MRRADALVSAMNDTAPIDDVTRVSALGIEPLRALFGAYGLEVVEVAGTSPIPGSYWGDCEAGLVGARLFLRGDTPVHSALHEGCHFVCMDASRRRQLDTDAGGDDLEESAVCYLQCVLAERLSGYSRTRIFADMDAWGYSFRLGSSRAWFVQDADDAREWLISRGLPVG